MDWVDYLIIGLMLMPPVFVLGCLKVCWLMDKKIYEKRLGEINEQN